MRFLLFCLIGLVNNSSVFAGLSLTQVTNIPETIDTPLVLNDTLVYLDENKVLWFNHGTSNGSFKPTISNNEILAYSPKILDDYIFFINQSDNNSLWKTDIQSFTKVSDIPLKRLSSYQSNLINSQIIGSNDLLTIEAERIHRYSIDPFTLSINDNSSLRSAFVCAFDSQTFVFRALTPNSGPSRYHFYQSGVITDIAFDPDLANLPDFLFQHKNNCIYKHYDFVNKRAAHFKINSSGEVLTIQNPDDEKSYNDFFVFNDTLYTFLEDSYGNKSSQIYTLSADSTEPVLSYLLDDAALDIDSFWVSSNYFYVLNIFNCYPFAKCSPLPDFINKLIVFDRSFNKINEILDDSIQTLTVDVNSTHDYLINKKRANELTTLNQGFKELSINESNIELVSILGGEHVVFVQGFDHLKNKSVIYKLSESPKISKQLSGLWVSDEWQSQGLSLHTGIRPDHSEYIFASFYIYKEGQPFWVAGNVDMDIGSDSISLDLAEYKGSSFLANDPANETEQIPFGSLTLTPQSCNTLNALIKIDGEESVELEMRRITDTTYDNICAD